MSLRKQFGVPSITARQITNTQPMTGAGGSSFYKTRQMPHKQFDLYAADAHKVVGAYIDVKGVREAVTAVGEWIHKQKKLLKSTQRENCARRAADPQAPMMDTYAMRDQLDKHRVRAARLSNFLHWLKVGEQKGTPRGLSVELLRRLIDEFFTDVITKLGRVVE